MAPEMLKAIEARKNLYRFLSQVYLMEIDEDLMSQMKKLTFPEDVCNEHLSEGYALLRKEIDRCREADLDLLAADYAKVFLAAGIAQGKAAFPYESVYTSKRRLAGQEARVNAAQFYADYGLELGKPTFKIPEDHIAAEFEFMAYLCEQWVLKETEAQKKDNLKSQKKFFSQHIINWAVMFCADAERYAQTDFYRGLAKITRGFLQEEKAMFSRI